MRHSERSDDLSAMGEHRRSFPMVGVLVGVLEMIGRWRRSTTRDISHRLPEAPSQRAAVVAVEPARTIQNIDPVRGHSITEVDVRVMIATPQPDSRMDPATIDIDHVDRPPAEATNDHAPEPTSDGTPPAGIEADHVPLGMLLLVFNRYDELARGGSYVELDSATMDDEIWLDLVEGPAARFVDRTFSSPTRHTIRLVTGETIHRQEETASWDVDLLEVGYVDDPAPGLVVDLDVFAIETSG